MNPTNNNQGQQFAPGQYQTPTYRDVGFTPFLERQPSTYIANEQLQSLISPFLAEVDESGFLFTPFTDMNQVNNNAVISGQQVQGGQTASNNGNMVIDYTQGSINFQNNVTSTILDVNGVSTTPLPSTS